uniref:Bac_surface_Ag domain-containing protein n=1 Tax=Angiostrongylus cantonensis TaxID=6313 RepID=A0A0K0DN11_ANGCA
LYILIFKFSARLAQEFAGPFGDSSFIKHQLDLQVFFQRIISLKAFQCSGAATPLPLGFILSGSAQFKNVRGDREIHLLDRVYLGGQQDVRGFGLNTLGVRSENSCLGGGTAVCGVLHIYRPLFPPQMLFAHMFVSTGSVAPVRSRNVVRDLQDAQRVSIGLGG